MPEKSRDSEKRLPEDLRRDALLPRSQAKGSKRFQPQAHGVPDSVSRVPSWREIELNPGPFMADPRSNVRAENGGLMPHDLVRQRRILRRVLDRMGRQSAPIADEMTEQAELFARHGVVLWPLKNARHSDTIAGLQLVETAPAFERPKLVVRGGADRPAKCCDHPEGWLPTRGKGIRHSFRAEHPVGFVERENPEVSLPDQISDRNVLTGIRQVHQAVAGDASGLSKVAQDRALVGPLLGGAAQLRDRDHGNAQLSREALQGAGDCRDLLYAVVVAARAAVHQLQVVDEDHVDPVPHLGLPRLQL